jgi:hypothetical protein
LNGSAEKKWGASNPHKIIGKKLRWNYDQVFAVCLRIVDTEIPAKIERYFSFSASTYERAQGCSGDKTLLAVRVGRKHLCIGKRVNQIAWMKIGALA